MDKAKLTKDNLGLATLKDFLFSVTEYLIPVAFLLFYTITSSVLNLIIPLF